MSLPAIPVIPIPWASSGGTFTVIPKNSPGSNTAGYDTGFPNITMQPEVSGGLPPLWPDVNGILNAITCHLMNLEAGNPYLYSSTFEGDVGGYPLGALLGASDGTSLWYSIEAANSDNPDTTPGHWVPAFSYGEASVSLAGGSVTLTPAQYRRGIIVLTGTLTGNVNVVFPTLFLDWVVINNTTGAFSATAKTSAGTGVVIPQTGPSAPSTIYCDGTNIQSTGISTAGLAPLASPAFTGTPTAPTPAGASNNTSIATTAFVKTAIAPLATTAAVAAAVAPLAPLAAPHLTGVPTAPTNVTPTDSSTQIATDAFVQAAIIAAAGGAVSGGRGWFAIGPWVVNFGPVPAQSDSAYHALTFAQAYPNACFGVVMTANAASQNTSVANANTSVLEAEGISKTGFNYIMSSNWNIGVVGMPAFYVAVGN